MREAVLVTWGYDVSSRPIAAPPPLRASRLELSQPAVLLEGGDDVAIAKRMLAPRTLLLPRAGGSVHLQQAVPGGHKFALRVLKHSGAVHRWAGDRLRRQRHPRRASTSTATTSRSARRDSTRLCRRPRTTRPVSSCPQPAERPSSASAGIDGRVGTRNYVAVLASVNCSSSATREVVETIRASGELFSFPERGRRDRATDEGRLRRPLRLARASRSSSERSAGSSTIRTSPRMSCSPSAARSISPTS